MGRDRCAVGQSENGVHVSICVPFHSPFLCHSRFKGEQAEAEKASREDFEMLTFSLEYGSAEMSVACISSGADCARQDTVRSAVPPLGAYVSRVLRGKNGVSWKQFLTCADCLMYV